VSASLVSAPAWLLEERKRRLQSLAQRDPYRHPPAQRTYWDWQEIRRREEPPHWLSEDGTRRLHRNMMLAGTRLDVLEALCRGESVPIEVLDEAQVRAYGLR
jgi:hypothetical protein